MNFQGFASFIGFLVAKEIIGKNNLFYNTPAMGLAAASRAHDAKIAASIYEN